MENYTKRENYRQRKNNGNKDENYKCNDVNMIFFLICKYKRILLIIIKIIIAETLCK